MRWFKGRRFTMAGLCAIIAVCAVSFGLLRPKAPPDEGQAILLARSFLQASNEFNYPSGYWARAVWTPVRGAWRVGFIPARRDGGGSLMVEVFPDHSCQAGSFDPSFFELW